MTQSLPAAIAAFEPTGDETTDVGRLYELTDAIESAGATADVTPLLLAIFERYPNADLGSPGPIVHCIETTGIDAFVPHLVASLHTTPTMATLQMAGRCLRSNPSETLLQQLIAAVRSIPANTSAPQELRDEATSTLDSDDA